MTGKAEQHLIAARDYVAKGEEFYRKAGAEMAAAKAEGATWTQIGDSVGHSDRWCKGIVDWCKTPANSGTYTAELLVAERTDEDGDDDDMCRYGIAEHEVRWTPIRIQESA